REPATLHTLDSRRPESGPSVRQNWLGIPVLRRHQYADAAPAANEASPPRLVVMRATGRHCVRAEVSNRERVDQAAVAAVARLTRRDLYSAQANKAPRTRWITSPPAAAEGNSP